MLTKMHIAITPLLFFEFVLLVVFSIVIIYSSWMLIMTLTIWFPKLSNLSDLLFQVNQISKFPQEIYKGASNYLLFVLFPLTVIVVTPAKQVLHKAQVGDILLLIIFAISLFSLSRFFWRFALRFYTSASG
jgi:ABC-2 type transport system permease protein